MPAWWPSGKWIVAAQVAISMLLLGSAALFGRSLYALLAQPAGVDRQNVLVVAADVDAAGFDDDRGARFYEDLVERVRQLPGVESASVSMYPPLSGGDGAWTDNVGIDGTPPGAGSTVYFNTVSRAYFSTTGMTLGRGRDINDADVATSLPVAVINETLARRFFPGQDPIGQQSRPGATRRARIC